MLGRIGRRNAALVMAAAFLALGTAARAQSASTLSLTVSPMVLEFHADAGTPAATTVTVRNNGNVPERIVAQRMDWRTSQDGAVSVEPIGTEGTSSIANYLRLAPEDTVLAPGETRQFALTLDLPASFPAGSAVYRGGFFIRGIPATGTAMFGPAATVVVYDTIGTPVTHVKLTQLHVAQDGAGTASVVARVINDGIGYARPSARIVVSQAGHAVSDETENMSVIFGGAPRLYTKSVGGLSAGDYDLTMTIDYGGATLLEGTTSFHIPMIRFFSAVLLVIACTARASAITPAIAVTVTSATVKFAASDLKTTMLAGSTTVSASVTYTTTATGSGSIVINAPTTLTGSSTDSLSTRNISIECVRASGDNHFTSSGIVALNGATTCATLASGRSAVTTAFTITLYLNDTATSAPLAFDASTFGPGTITVTGTAS